MMRQVERFSSVGLVLFLSACAFGTRTPTLYYPPATEPGVVSAANAAVPASQKGAPIVLEPFVDQRTDKSKIGTVRNGFGMATADVVPTNNVAEWVTGAIRTELERDGYTVVAAPEPGMPATVLSGKIQNVWCDMYFTYLGEIAFDARLSRNGKEVLAKRYEANGSAGVVWGATAESFAQTLAIALSSAVKQMISDLSSSIAARPGKAAARE